MNSLDSRLSNYLSGPLTRFGFAVAAIACLLDQASKLYLLFVHDLAANPVRLGPFFDFVLFHVSAGTWRFNWYVFNLADVTIVAGVIGLLYESLVQDRAAKAP